MLKFQQMKIDFNNFEKRTGNEEKPQIIYLTLIGEEIYSAVFNSLKQLNRFFRFLSQGI